MRHGTVVIPLLLLLLCAAPAAAADLMQEAIEQKTNADKDQQQKLLNAAKILQGEAPKQEKAFPGPAQQTQRQQPQQQEAGTPPPRGAQGPKSTKPMYGDIIIHK